MNLMLDGKTALVFGGSKGLGRAVAAELGVDNAMMGPKIPAGRLGEPAEFAALAALISSFSQ
jgi:NAD(P)-dependent dehydrogenase (short-subunit alcohol dehydrogenase family)